MFLRPSQRVGRRSSFLHSLLRSHFTHASTNWYPYFSFFVLFLSCVCVYLSTSNAPIHTCVHVCVCVCIFLCVCVPGQGEAASILLALKVINGCPSCSLSLSTSYNTLYDDLWIRLPLTIFHSIHRLLSSTQLLFIIGLYMFYSFGQTVRNEQYSHHLQFEKMRLTTSHFRGTVSGNGSSAASSSLLGVSSAGVQSLGLLYDGCPLDIQHEEFFKGSSHYVSFGRQVRASGYSFRTLAQPDTQHLDAIVFTVAVCNTKTVSQTTQVTIASPLECAEDGWRDVGSSRCLWSMYGLNCINVKDGMYETSRQRDYQHKISLTPSQLHTHNLLAHPFYVIVGSWGAVALALFGRHHAVYICMSCMYI